VRLNFICPACRGNLEQRAKKWEAVFCKKRCANKEIEQDADSELTHLAQVVRPVRPPDKLTKSPAQTERAGLTCDSLDCVRARAYFFPRPAGEVSEGGWGCF
jgi:hypothetical protein